MDDELGLPDDIGLPDELGLLEDVGAPEAEPLSPMGLSEKDEVSSPSVAAPELSSPSLAAPQVASPSATAPDEASPSTPAVSSFSPPSRVPEEDSKVASPSATAPDEASPAIPAVSSFSPPSRVPEEDQSSPSAAPLAGKSPRKSLTEQASAELSPRVLGPRVSQADIMNQAMQAHLFGGSAPKASVEAASNKHKRRSVAERREAMQRIQAPKLLKIAELDEQCTFRPSISDASRALADATRDAEDEPRYVALSRPNVEAREKISRLSVAAAELEMASCTFKPDIGDPSRFTNVQAKFLDAGYERYTKPKKAPVEEAKESPKKLSPGGSASPRSPKYKQFRDSPTSPRVLTGSVHGLQLNAYRNAEDAPGSARGEAVHIARARAARDKKAEHEAKLAKMGQPVNDAQWLSRRTTTTPIPFCSHTGIRNKQRKQLEEERLVEKTVVVSKMYKELHEQLHSLELGGPPKWFS